MSALTQIALPEIAADVLAGLSATPKSLSPKLFYDARGSALFEEITRLPEYYLTRAETAILAQRSSEIARRAGRNVTVIELGAGTAQKTLLLLSALSRVNGSIRYLPVDVSTAALRKAKLQIQERCPAVQVDPAIADLNGLGFLSSTRAPRLVLYIGSSIGNLEPADAAALLRRLRKRLDVGDHLLLGTDLAKSPRVLLPAYADAAGVTAAFNKNILARINRELGGQFVLENFQHLARWNRKAQRIEMYLQSLIPQSVAIDLLDVTVRFQRGELLHTENSYKYTLRGVRKMLEASGFSIAAAWRDPQKRFAVHLAQAA